MFSFETQSLRAADAERITCAFYRFLEAHADEADGEAYLRTELAGRRRSVLVRLWSAEALDAFRSDIRPICAAA